MLPATFAAKLDSDALFCIEDFMAHCATVLGFAMDPVYQGKVVTGELLEDLFICAGNDVSDAIAAGGLFIAKTRAGAVMLDRFDSARVTMRIVNGPVLGIVTIEEATPIIAALYIVEDATE